MGLLFVGIGGLVAAYCLRSRDLDSILRWRFRILLYMFPYEALYSQLSADLDEQYDHQPRLI